MPCVPEAIRAQWLGVGVGVPLPPPLFSWLFLSPGSVRPVSSSSPSLCPSTLFTAPELSGPPPSPSLISSVSSSLPVSPLSTPTSLSAPATLPSASFIVPAPLPPPHSGPFMWAGCLLGTERDTVMKTQLAPVGSRGGSVGGMGLPRGLGISWETETGAHCQPPCQG